MTKPIKPYLSIDIETTGLDLQKANVLEIAAVFDDGVSKVEDLLVFHELVAPQDTYYELYAMSMHSELLIELRSNALFSIETVGSRFDRFIEEIALKYPEVKFPLTIAGKNASGFDLPILKNKGFPILYSHRVIDVGSVYFSDFGYVPSLNEINEKIGYEPVKHRALDDAYNVIYAVRNKLGKINAN